MKDLVETQSGDIGPAKASLKQIFNPRVIVEKKHLSSLAAALSQMCTLV